MNISYRIFWSWLLIFCLPALASTTNDNTSLAKQFTTALLCQSAAIDARDPATAVALEQQQIIVKNFDEDGLIDLEYQMAKPFKILDVTIPIIRYQGDSGSYFFAVAEGDMATFANAVGAKPLTEPLSDLFTWGEIGQYYQYSSPDMTENSYPNIILIGRDQNSKTGEFYFGCREFDN